MELLAAKHRGVPNTRPPLPAASPLSAGGGRFMAAASPLLDAAVQLEVGAREQCECDPCCSDGEEFDEACSHGTHCAACQVWQTGLWKDCCVYLKMGKLGHVHRSKAGRLRRAMEGDGDRGRGNKDRSGGKGSNHKRKRVAPAAAAPAAAAPAAADDAMSTAAWANNEEEEMARATRWSWQDGRDEPRRDTRPGKLCAGGSKAS